jgi:hypothetical protein
MALIRFGSIPTVKEGQVFPSREALSNAGLHRSHQRGIDGNTTDGAAAIVLAGGFKDNYDLGDEILYTGEGGNDPATGRQIGDQDINSPGNSGLIESMNRKLPVRVIRSSNHKSQFSPKSGYRYDGIYYVVDYQITKGKDGFVIIRFVLRKEQQLTNIVMVHSLVKLELLNSNNEVKYSWYSIGIDPPENFYASKIGSESNLAINLLGKSVGDEFQLGPSKGKINSILKYKS